MSWTRSARLRRRRRKRIQEGDGVGSRPVLARAVDEQPLVGCIRHLERLEVQVQLAEVRVMKHLVLASAWTYVVRRPQFGEHRTARRDLIDDLGDAVVIREPGQARTEVTDDLSGHLMPIRVEVS